MRSFSNSSPSVGHSWQHGAHLHLSTLIEPRCDLPCPMWDALPRAPFDTSALRACRLTGPSATTRMSSHTLSLRRPTAPTLRRPPPIGTLPSTGDASPVCRAAPPPCLSGVLVAVAAVVALAEIESVCVSEQRSGHDARVSTEALAVTSHPPVMHAAPIDSGVPCSLYHCVRVVPIRHRLAARAPVV